MLRKFGMPLKCLAMFSIVGGHLAVLQGAAWATMLWDYSREASFTEAAEKTFSGANPCSLCKTVAKTRQQEEKIPATLKVEKIPTVFLTFSQPVLGSPFPREFCYPLAGDSAVPVRPGTPPMQPPRATGTGPK